MKIVRLLSVLLVVATLTACAPSPGSATHVAAPADSKIAADWMSLVCQTLEGEAKSPLEASRIVAYSSVALYEALVPGLEGYRSLSGQLNEMPAFPQPDSGATYDWPAAAAAAMSETLNGLFTGASDNTQAAIANLKEAQITAQKIPADVRAKSEIYGLKVSRAILAWASTDGFKETRDMTYTPPQGAGLWVPTGPGFQPALEPYWGTLRPFALYSVDSCVPPPPFPYSEDKNSCFYQQALAVYETSRALNDEEIAIALFWADNLGGTTSGHWLSIEDQAISRLDMTLGEAAELYALTGIASADAYISCWRAKFQYCVERPVTYINAFIDPGWEPVVNTPPFPEYTPAHSVVSGAVSTVLSSLLGKVTFRDETYVSRGLPARTFNSFEAAAQEAAVSRLYGGIHYPISIQQGLVQGKAVGENTLNRLQTRTK